MATKFIGRGSVRSSTAAYARAWGEGANSGDYEASDTVFVSAEGARSGRRTPDFDEIQRAADAQATFLTDTPTERSTRYNVGEREVAAFLIERGYQEDGPGVWTKTMPKRPQRRSARKAPAQRRSKRKRTGRLLPPSAPPVAVAVSDTSRISWRNLATPSPKTLAKYVVDEGGSCIDHKTKRAARTQGRCCQNLAIRIKELAAERLTKKARPGQLFSEPERHFWERCKPRPSKFKWKGARKLPRSEMMLSIIKDGECINEVTKAPRSPAACCQRLAATVQHKSYWTDEEKDFWNRCE